MPTLVLKLRAVESPESTCPQKAEQISRLDRDQVSPPPTVLSFGPKDTHLASSRMGIPNIESRVCCGERPACVSPRYDSDPRSPAPPVPEDHQEITALRTQEHLGRWKPAGGIPLLFLPDQPAYLG